ncbi:MAG: hypothetical protein QOI41_1678, partial [Myxococcales bacterium]|nr:hypothetical protein [Myxococcales bacterium]
MNVSSKCFVSLCLVLLFAGGCSSSDTSTPAAANDAGSGADSAVMMGSDASASTDASTSADVTQPSSTAPCAYSVSGDRTDPTTDALSCPGHLEQVSGMGDYTINVAAVFESAAKDNVSLGFTLSSPTLPAAGDTWTLGQDGRTGNLTLTVTKGQAGTIWSTSDTDSAMVKGGTRLTFVSVTMTKGMQKPQDVYYLFEVTLETTLVGRTAGATSTKVVGHFKATALP